jgi:two-component system cell cycle response regulator DivK
MAARILVIEDSPASLDLLTFLLRKTGHTALEAKDGEKGLQIARREKPDLVICDLQVPRVNGYEIARQIRGDPQICNMPLVAVTAFAMQGDGDKVMEAGFDGYITKPIAPREFVGQLEPFLRPSSCASHPALPKSI